MDSFIVKLLQSFAAWLDKTVPGKGARHLVCALLAVVSTICLFLVGSIAPADAAHQIATILKGLIVGSLSLSNIFAALHQVTAPAAPLSPPSA